MNGLARVDATVEPRNRLRVLAAPVHRLVAAPLQRELQAGMSAIDVVESLGAPQMVTRGPAGREAWTWDHVSSGRIRATGRASGLLTGAGVGDAAAVCVIVRFDERLRVSCVVVHALP